MQWCTDFGRPVKKSPSLHGRKSTPTPKFLGTAEAYFVRHIGQNFQISLIYAFIHHWVSVVRAVMFTLKQTHRENGSVTITMAQENAVRSQPQMPMPTSLSWAMRERKKDYDGPGEGGKKPTTLFFSRSSGQQPRHCHLWLASYCLLLGHPNHHAASFPMCLFQGKHHWMPALHLKTLWKH